jgi:hypothetical protein
VTMCKLVGGRVPSHMRNGMWPRAQHRRRMLQIRFPFTRVPFCLATLAAEARNYRAHSAQAAGTRPVDRMPRRGRRAPIAQRVQRLRHLMTMPVTSKL